MSVVAPAALAVTPAYQLLDLQTLGGVRSEAWSINNSGQVAGWSIKVPGANRPFLTAPNSPINPLTDELPLVIGASNGYAYGVNSSGQATGENATASGDRAVRYSAGAVGSLGTLGGGWSYAYAINNLGHVVGNAARPKQGNNFPVHAFLHDGTSMFDLGTLGGQDSYATAINSSGKVAGYSQTSGGAALDRAFVWTPATTNGTSGSMTAIPTLGGSTSYAWGINDAGAIVGSSQIALDVTSHAFLRPAAGGALIDLGTLGGFSEARDINESGMIVGFSHNGTQNRAFVHSSGVMHDLNSLVSNLSGWTLIEARSINDSGQIVGIGTTAFGEKHGYLLTPLPTWLLNGNGSWSTGGNWLGGVPNSPTAEANFTDAIDAARIVTVDAPVSVHKITFNNLNSYTLAGTSTLSISGAAAGSGINVVSGLHEIQSPLALAGSVAMNVAPGATLSISGEVLADNTVSLQKTGGGALAISRIVAGALSVAEGTAAISSNSGPSKVTTLAIAGGATLDLTDGAMIVDYDAVSPFNDLQTALLSGRNGGSWDGAGLTSSTAASAGEMALALVEASDLGASEFAGEAFVGDAVIAAVALVGDTNLDGHVDTMDFNQLAGAFGNGGGWTDGDANYDGVIDSTDFTALIGNYGQSMSWTVAALPGASVAGATVPEPHALSTLLLTAFVCNKRRRGYR